MKLGEHLGLCSLWLVRVLSALAASPATRDRIGHLDKDTCRLAGLPKWDDNDAGRFDRIAQRLRTLEENATGATGPLFENAEALARAIGLTPLERDLLALTIAAEAIVAVKDAFGAAGPLTSYEAVSLIATALVVPAEDVHAALQPDQVLVEAGLVRWNEHSRYAFPLDPLDAIVGPMLRPQAHPDAILHSLVRPPPPPELGVEDYPHLAAHVDRLQRLLTRALEQRVPGLDILLHGPPGTGKTQLARVLAQSVGGALVEVAPDHLDSPIRGDRLDIWVLAQRVLTRSPNALVVFDEAEDAFPCENPFAPRRRMRSKGWFTQHLERHPIPTIWIANDIDQIEPAFLRRFDVVLELREPPATVRRRVLDHHLGDLPIGEDVRNRYAQDPRVRPAHVGRAARALNLLEPTGRSDAEPALAAFLDPQLERIGRPPPQYRHALSFDARISGASHDLDVLADALARSGRGAVCLYGPPGTGKTAWAHELARRADRPLHVRGASDILGMFVGSTERNLASVFQQAAEDGAILLLDEVDSLLRDRGAAVRSWEVTQVNELLMQLDRFDGLVLCATNRLGDLDPASLRRFAVKVGFEPPGREGRRLLVQRALAQLGTDADTSVLAAVDTLDGLTPGDVAATIRQLELLGTRTGEALIHALRTLPRPSSTAVGFR